MVKNLILTHNPHTLPKPEPEPKPQLRQVLSGKDLKRCSKNLIKPVDPYDAVMYHKQNRKLLKQVKTGSVVSYRAGSTWVQTKVIRVVQSGGYRNVVYHVDSERCLNQSSVRLTRCMITRARRDNRVWGSGCRNPATLTERHCISAATYEHLRGWIFNKKFLEILKASEQSKQRGHYL